MYSVNFFSFSVIDLLQLMHFFVFAILKINRVGYCIKMKARVCFVVLMFDK